MLGCEQEGRPAGARPENPARPSPTGAIERRLHRLLFGVVAAAAVALQAYRQHASGIRVHSVDVRQASVAADEGWIEAKRLSAVRPREDDGFEHLDRNFIASGTAPSPLSPGLAERRRRPARPDVYFAWMSPAEAFGPREFRVFESYLYHHPDARATVFAKHLPPGHFRRYADAGYDVRLRRVDSALLRRLGEDGGCRPGLRAEGGAGRDSDARAAAFIRFCMLHSRGGFLGDFDTVLIRPLRRWPGAAGSVVALARRPPGDRCGWCLPGGNSHLTASLAGSGRGSALSGNAMRLVALGPGPDPGDRPPGGADAVAAAALTRAYAQDPRNVTVCARLVAQLPPAGDPGPRGHPDLERVRRTYRALRLPGGRTTPEAEAEAEADPEQGAAAEEALRAFAVLADGGGGGGPAAGSDAAASGRIRGPEYLGVNKRFSLVGGIRLVPPREPEPGPAVLKYKVTAVAKRGRLRLLQDPEPASRMLTFEGPSPRHVNRQLAALAYRAGEGGSDCVRVEAFAELPGAVRSLGTLRTKLYHVQELATVVVRTAGRMDRVFSVAGRVQEHYPGVRVVAADFSPPEPAGAARRLRNGLVHLPLPPRPPAAAAKLLMAVVETEYVLFVSDADVSMDARGDVPRLLHELEARGLDAVAAWYERTAGSGVGAGDPDPPDGAEPDFFLAGAARMRALEYADGRAASQGRRRYPLQPADVLAQAEENGWKIGKSRLRPFLA
ncbi:MAG: hypothetical protein BJ554DRAFT_8336 [Olpidium bornovanus]|uniref:Uncharacterized protein n=1 Tax=Olpidium bornovanus TaxID=278681 RepID=A0A8H8DIP4_9FUNG|nr:MAG: hypothetical protein BJ554DRAFT_8336 [Olpidium bornovanus]